MPRLVLLGAGHSHIEVLRRVPALAMRAEIVVVDPHPALPYTGMVPGYVAGIYGAADVLIDVASVCARARATLRPARAVGIDTASREVRCDDGTIVPYDILSIDIGSTLDTSVPGVVEHALPVRPLWRFMKAWPDAQKRGSRIAVVGAGAGGIELALAAHAASAARGGTPQIAVVGDALRIAPGIAPRAQAELEEACNARNIGIRLGVRVVRVTRENVVLDDGSCIPADNVLWATGPAPHAWLRTTGLALDPHGYLAMDRCLRVGGRPDVYAAGDIAGIIGHPRPKSGVYAVREAPVLAENLRRALRGESPRAYIPQRRALALIGTGDRRAVASYGPLGAEGAWVWRWKDAIDRRFVQRYRECRVT